MKQYLLFANNLETENLKGDFYSIIRAQDAAENITQINLPINEFKIAKVNEQGMKILCSGTRLENGQLEWKRNVESEIMISQASSWDL